MKKFKPRFWGVGFLVTPIILTACINNNSNEIVIGNYQSYISPWLANNLSQKYNLKFDYFNTAEEVPARYQVNNYDAAIASSSVLESLIKTQAVKKLNWAYFNIKNAAGELITTADEALTLFTKPVKEILTNIYTYDDGQKINLLDYGIPYFLQTFNFAYRGEKIEALHPENEQKLSWEQMLEVISQEERFHSAHQYPQLAMVNDARTLLSISELMNPKNQGVNPTTNAQSIDALGQAYQSFVTNGINGTNLGRPTVLLNSDSNVIINQLAAEPPGVGSSAGGFMYNGDILYASNGGDNGTEISWDDLHIVKNDTTLYALDLMNFSAQVPEEITAQSQLAIGSKLDRLYRASRSLILEGVDQESFLTESEVNADLTETEKTTLATALSANCPTDCLSYDANFISDDVDDGGAYVYGPMINFNYVQYTPVLKKLYNEVLGIVPIEETLEIETSETTSAVMASNDLFENDDLTWEQVKAFATDSYFYTKPTDVYFGKKAEGLDYAQMNLTNWQDYLSVTNFLDDSNLDQTENPIATSDQKLVVTDLIVTTAEEEGQQTNFVTITYQLQAVNDDSIISENTVTYPLSQTALENFAIANTAAINKVLLNEEIMMINYFAGMGNFVEKKLSDLARSNMLIAFNELKSQW